MFLRSLFKCNIILILMLFIIFIGSPINDLAAQSVAARKSNPALGPTDFLSAALNVVDSVDRYEMGDVWDRSSPIMKASVPRDRFVSNTAQKRASLGAVSSRNWISIGRIVVVDNKSPLPPGQYISVKLVTNGSSGVAMEEIISFHLDVDGQWKLAGYTIIV
ncbi:DUF4019 domain-containing protein [Blastomonas sp. SL216]|uniref:DUF4019 domain-containing protein n=1 Tax=Blastomonas sp. SL216 TaxID=2995169 RepID=UPI0023773B68|nr:DUF4019 domain-containing protein [Blastomonas sp. SL216]